MSFDFSKNILKTLKANRKVISDGSVITVLSSYPHEGVSYVQVSIDRKDLDFVEGITAVSDSHQKGLLGLIRKVEDAEIKAFLRSVLCDLL